MTDEPVFSRKDAHRILKRAAEIEGSEDPRPLTLSELQSKAGEAGLGQKTLQRAIAQVRRSGARDPHPPPVHRSGLLFVHLSTVRSLSVEITTDQLMKVVRLFQPYRDGPAVVELEEGLVAWRDRRGLRFTLTSGGGVTELRVYVAKFLLRKGRWMGWVKNAADRLESIILLMEDRDTAVSRDTVF